MISQPAKRPKHRPTGHMDKLRGHMCRLAVVISVAKKEGADCERGGKKFDFDNEQLALQADAALLPGAESNGTEVSSSSSNNN